MAKTMNEYYNELLENIPTPETLMQMKLAENVERAISELSKNGRYYFTTCYTGSRKSEITMMHKVINVFSKKGYSVKWYEYSENNRYDIFWAEITM